MAGTSGRALVKKSKIPEPTIVEQPQIETFDVDHVTYVRHHKSDDHIPSVRVSYKCGLRSFDEWVFFDEGAAFRAKGRSWWLQRANCDPGQIPQTVNEALAHTDTLRIPKRIKVHVNTKYPRVVDYEYAD